MITAFDYNSIRMNDSKVNDKIRETEEFYLSIPEDNFFKYLREDAGEDAPGEYYTGWFVGSRGVSLTGQWISAFSRMYALTGNVAFKEKAIRFFEEFYRLTKKLEGTSKPTLTRKSFYPYEKLLRAICDLKIYCEYEEAARWLPELLDFAETTLSRDNILGDNTTEWYTMPESLYSVWQIFGLEKAKELAKIWEYPEFWELFYKNLDPFSRKPKAGLYSEFFHAYSHTNSMNSCAKAYEVTGDPRYLKTIRSFYRFMQSEEVMATGGYGPNFEHIMPKNRIIDALRTGHDNFETQCDTYAAFRLSKYLTEFTAEPDYGNWVELLIWNAAVSTIPMTKDGKVIYYSDYNMYGAAKVNRADGWTCCTGTRPLLMVEIPRLIYFHDDSDLYISQYIPSSVTWDRSGNCIQLTQSTDFPVKDEICFEIKADAPAVYSLHFRLPAWLERKAELKVTNEADQELTVECTVDKNGWLCVSREWNNGDRICLALHQTVYMHSFDPALNGPNAFLHGPVVLAASYTGIQTPNDWMDIRKLLPKMKEVPEKPLHYTVDGIDTICFKPFYEYEENERYFLYHDTTAHATDRFA